jgi:peptidoglycan/xylan/chitin deacetylase (PgdA/CDA1 family)
MHGAINMPRLILNYHATRLETWTRSGADLLALAADLAELADVGIPVLPLAALLAPDCRDGVAITFDDGTRMDGESIVHPVFGRLPSMLSVLAAARARLPQLRVSSFVIASPQARADLNAGLIGSYGPSLMDQGWWLAATQSGLMDLENHSWDHNHPMVQRSVQRDNRRGNFFDIETDAEAEAEIVAASDYIEAVVGRRPRYFAYPFGDVGDYLRRHWLPGNAARVGLVAAFGTEARALAGDDDRWALPRFVSGRDWRDAGSLAALLRGA